MSPTSTCKVFFKLLTTNVFPGQVLFNEGALEKVFS